MMLLGQILILFALSTVLAIIQNEEIALEMHSENPEKQLPKLSFSQEWHVLGPFRLGTREAIWGADPLEARGGFHALTFHSQDIFASPLAANASIGWSSSTPGVSASASTATVRLNLDFREIDWQFAQSVYGWAALQYQAWARGSIYNHESSPLRVELYTDGVLEFWINDDHYFGGDFYSFRRAPLVLTLLPGDNVIDIRLVRDVRAMGGTLPPPITVTLEAKIPAERLSVSKHIIAPDLVDGRLASPYISVTVRNLDESWISIYDCITVKGVRSSNLLGKKSIDIAPGQSRPLAILLIGDESVVSDVELKLMYKHVRNSSQHPGETLVRVILHNRLISDPHKYTFLHPSGAVSYAILQAPKVPTNPLTTKTSLPILLNLHGAGLEADSYQVRHQLDSVSVLNAWTIFPTGMSPWSGDDWHSWALSDVKAAVAEIPLWMTRVNWNGSDVSLERWLVSGHSNGGQGSWYISTHQPDKVFAAAPVSGYTSIENYVPYLMWHEADPLKSALLQISRTSFRHELLSENLHSMPILQQHGSDDDNVPPYHSRLMNSILRMEGFAARFVELAGKGHWFDDAMATRPLKEFYEKYLTADKSPMDSPNDFSIICPNSDDMGSRHGISVLQLESPDKLGRIDVKSSREKPDAMWHITTLNIHRFNIHNKFYGRERPFKVVLDDSREWFSISTNPESMSFTRLNDGKWVATQEDGHWERLGQRYGRQRGALDAIMRSTGPFQLVAHSEDVVCMATQTSRNMLQYYGADSEILFKADYGIAIKRGGNVISFVLGQTVPKAVLDGFPFSFELDCVYLRQRGQVKSIPFAPGMGAVFLRPLELQRLELVVWGFDEAGLRQAARLIPTLTGGGQPDFIILDNKARWRGHSGALAMGFFDYEWNISSASYLP